MFLKEQVMNKPVLKNSGINIICMWSMRNIFGDRFVSAPLYLQPEEIVFNLDMALKLIYLNKKSSMTYRWYNNKLSKCHLIL